MTWAAILQHVIAWLPLVIGGILLIRAGLRGRRVNDHPICRRCRFDLVGLAGPNPDATSRPDRCPECGTALTGNTRRARRAVIDGERKKRWRLFALGVVLLVSGLTTGFWLTYKPLAKFPWTTWMPDWVLAEMVERPSASRPSPVVNEVLQRLTRGDFSRAAMRRAAAEVLRVQADREVAWNDMLGTVMQRARSLKLLDDHQWQTYAQQSIYTGLRARPSVGKDEWIVVQLVVHSRGAFVSGGGDGVSHVYAGVTPLGVPAAGGVPLGDPSGLRSGLFSASRAREIVLYEFVVPNSLSVGRHTVEQRVLLQYGDELPPGRTIGSAGIEFARHDSYTPSISSVEVVLTADFEVLDQPTPVALVRPSPGSQLSAPAVPIDLVLDYQRNGLFSTAALNWYVDARGVADGIAAELLIRPAPDAEAHLLGAVVHTSKESVGPHNRGSVMITRKEPALWALAEQWRASRGGTVTVILRPAPEIAKQTVDLTEIWGEEIVIENVPITLEWE